MKQIFVFAAGIALAHPAFAQELVKIETRPGVTQSFLIANMGKRKPDAAAKKTTLQFLPGERRVVRIVEDQTL